VNKRFRPPRAAISFAGLAFATLLGASALAAPLSWTVLTLEGAWKPYASATRQPTVAIDAEGIVHLRGAMRGAGRILQEAFVLPLDFRPNKVVVVPVFSEGKGGYLQIRPDGKVLVFADDVGGAQEFTSLEGVTFSKN
jgi:hypothetical protein